MADAERGDETAGSRAMQLLEDNDVSNDELRAELDLRTGRRPEIGPRIVGGRHNEEAAVPPAPKAAAWLGPRDIVSLIRSRANEQWVSLGLGLSAIAEVRAGGIVTLCGPTGAGKTSLADGMAARFAREQGWVAVLSLELTADEMGGRMIGMATDHSWKQVLRGELSDEQMLAALPERLQMIEWEDGTLGALEAKLAEIRASHPEEPMLFVVDYGQLLVGATDELRAKVAGNWLAAKRIAARHRAVGLMLSQMSRQSSRAARAGERLGAGAVDGGAESGAVEHWSTTILEIGAAGPEDRYGRREVQLSIAKGRMDGGDMVLPMSYEGRTGRWAVIGNPRPAAEVRAEAQERAKEERVVDRRAKLVNTVATHGPMAKDAAVAKVGGNADLARVLFDQAAAAGEIVQVEQKRRGSSHWMWWTPDKAKENNVPIVGEQRGLL